jgi:hypothetical protein
MATEHEVRSLAVICVPQQSPVKLSRWAFRLLLEPAAAEFADHHNDRDDGLERRSDEFILRQAMALDGLNFDLLAEEDHGQAVRIAEVVARHAAALRLELRPAPAAISGTRSSPRFWAPWRCIWTASG